MVLQSFCSSLIESDKLWDTELMATAYVQYLKARKDFSFLRRSRTKKTESKGVDLADLSSLFWLL